MAAKYLDWKHMNKQKTKQVLVPELRFPEFKNEWEIEPMSDVYSFFITNSLSRDKLNYKKGAVKNIHYGDIHTKFPTLFDITKEDVPFINTDESIEKIKNDSYCIEGDIIFADASEDIDDIGKSIELINLNDEKLVSGLHTLLARQKEKKLIIGFGGYLFKSNGIRKQIQREAQGAKVLGISATRLSSISITYPKDKLEQRKIADCLSSIDETIEAETQKLDALQEHKKGLLQQLFPAEGATVPKLRFPKFKNDGEWEEMELGDIGEFIGGGTPSTSVPEYWNGNILWFTPSELKKRNVNTSKRTITEEGLQNSSAKLLPKGTLLISTRATIGDVSIADVECTTNQGFQSLIVNKSEVNEFWYYWLLHHKSKLVRRSSGSTFLEIGKTEIVKVVVLRPEKIEQKKIADCLSSIDDLIAAQTDKIDLLKDHKKGLLQQLFPSPNE